MSSLEARLEANLADTRAALADIRTAVEKSDDATKDSELRELRDQLEASIVETEEALLQLKKDRLLDDVEDSTESEDGSSESSESASPSNREDEYESAMDEMHAAVQDAVRNGQQRETAHFAEWEAHGRGVASKLMAQMGYVHGKGLGRDKQGVTSHIISKTTQASKRSGLGTSPPAEMGEKKKTRRGGRMKTARKKARLAKEALRAQQGQLDEEADSEGVFSILNRVIGDHSQRAKAERALNGRDSAQHETSGKRDSVRECQPSSSRELLIHQEKRVSECLKRVSQLEEAVKRNARNGSLLTTLKAKLIHAKRELAEAKQKHSRLSKDVQRTIRNQQSERF